MYIEGTSFGYVNSSGELYAMFGCNFLSDGQDGFNSISTITGQSGSIVADKSYNYIQDAYANHFVDEISSNGGKIIFKRDNDKGHGVTYKGANGNYRAIHTSILFGGIRDESARDGLMKIYMDYLLGNTLCIEEQYKPFVVNNLSVSPSLLEQSDRLNFTLIRPARVTIDFYNIAGQHICRFINEKLHEGSHQLSLQRVLSSGRYILKFEADKEVVNKLIVLTK